MTATKPPTGEVPTRRLWTPAMAAKYMNNGLSPRFVRRLMKEGRIATCDPYMNDRLLTWREAVDAYLESTTHTVSEVPESLPRQSVNKPKRKTVRDVRDELTWDRIRQEANGDVIPPTAGSEDVTPLTNDGMPAPVTDITEGTPWDMLNKIRERKAARRRATLSDQSQQHQSRISP